MIPTVGAGFLEVDVVRNEVDLRLGLTELALSFRDRELPLQLLELDFRDFVPDLLPELCQLESALEPFTLGIYRCFLELFHGLGSLKVVLDLLELGIRGHRCLGKVLRRLRVVRFLTSEEELEILASQDIAALFGKSLQDHVNFVPRVLKVDLQLNSRRLMAPLAISPATRVPVSRIVSVHFFLLPAPWRSLLLPNQWSYTKRPMLPQWQHWRRKRVFCELNIQGNSAKIIHEKQ